MKRRNKESVEGIKKTWRREKNLKAYQKGEKLDVGMKLQKRVEVTVTQDDERVKPGGIDEAECYVNVTEI